MQRGGVHRVVAGDDLVEQGGVQDRAGTGPGLVQGGGQGHEAVARDRPVGGLDADRAGDGSGLADRAAGVGADGQRGLEGREGGSAAAARAAGDPVEVPRVVGRAVGGVLGGGAHRELVHVGLAEDDDPGLAQAPGDGRVVRRVPALEDPRAAGGGGALHRQDVLERQRDAGQRARAPHRRRGRRRSRRPAARAPSESTCRNAWMSPSTAAIRSRWAVASSRAETAPAGAAARRAATR